MKALALKPYLKQISDRCHSLSSAELLELLLGLAQEILPADRRAFLKKIEGLTAEANGQADTDGQAVAKLLATLGTVTTAIEQRVAAIEDGEYWEDLDPWEADEGYDDMPDQVSREQVQSLVTLFLQAETLFLNGQLQEAQAVYQGLFALVDSYEDLRFLMPAEEIDLREAGARYCRCLYETAPLAERPERLHAAMHIEDNSHYGDVEERFNGSYPLLQDIIDTRRGELPELEEFLPEWCAVLEQKWTTRRGAVLLLEAVYLLLGLSGVAELAKSWKQKQPQGYLFWLSLLKEQQQWPELIAVSNEALGIIREGEIRIAVAEYLLIAARANKDHASLLQGRRVCFLSFPADEYLLHWLADVDNQAERSEALHTAIDCLHLSPPEVAYDDGLLVKCLLMAGQLQKAFSLAQTARCVGWSYALSAGVLFGALLWLLTDQNEQARLISQLLARYANDYSAPTYDCTQKEPAVTCFQEICQGLRANKPEAGERSTYLAWTVQLGQARIEHIVDHKQRNAYHRAAEVLGCLAETYSLLGQGETADNLVRLYYSIKYPRFTAFRREVKSVLATSPLLKSIRL